MESKKAVITITGPSGSGKTFLAGLLKGEGFLELVSTTTRPSREGEINGKDYHFIDDKTFLNKINDSEMVESVEFNGYRYGLTRNEFDRAFEKSQPVVVVCEPNGSHQIKQFADTHGWEVFRVYIENPLEVLLERLLKRFKGDLNGKPEIYASRIMSLLNDELNWKAEGIYELKIPVFNEENRDEIVSQLCSIAQQMIDGKFQARAS